MSKRDQTEWTKADIKKVAKKLYETIAGRSDQDLFEKIIAEFAKKGIVISMPTIRRYKKEGNWKRDKQKKIDQKNDQKNRSNNDNLDQKINLAKQIINLYLKGDQPIFDCCQAIGVSYTTFGFWERTIVEIGVLYENAKAQRRAMNLEALRHYKERFFLNKLENPTTTRTTVFSKVKIKGKDKVEYEPEKHILNTTEIPVLDYAALLEKYESNLTKEVSTAKTDKKPEEMDLKELQEHLKSIEESNWKEAMPDYD